MGLFNKNVGLMDTIRCDEDSYLIWKWHPKGSEVGTNKRENEIRWGSSLRVKDGEVAVFVYKQKDGILQDFIVGPFDQTIDTKNLPILTGIIGLAYAGKSPFQAEIYFINLAQIIQNKFAVPFFDVYDPRFADFGVPISVRGNITFKITDYKNFIKLHRLIDFNLDDFQNQIKDAVSKYVKNTVVSLPIKENIPLVQIESKITDVNEALEKDLKKRLKESFGVDLTAIDVSVIEVDKTSDGYRHLMEVTKNITSQTVQAEAAAKIKDISDKQRIEIEDYEENLRIKREEGQYLKHKQTQTDHMNAFQVEKQAEVGIAGAEALGHMGENGAGNVNLGGASNGFNPAAMMASMAVGNVVGQNIAGSISNIMNPNQTSFNTNKVDPYEEIKKLKTLLDEGIITEEEFNKKKKELLGL
jgi:Putative virion core protein (lumpy skin disease virus)